MMRPTYLRFPLEHNEDEEIICLFCSSPRCEQRFTAAGGGKMSIIGVHNSCAEKHMEKTLAIPKGDDSEAG